MNWRTVRNVTGTFACAHLAVAAVMVAVRVKDGSIFGAGLWAACLALNVVTVAICASSRLFEFLGPRR